VALRPPGAGPGPPERPCRRRPQRAACELAARNFSLRPLAPRPGARAHSY
jgi:hypothetical protein